MHCREYINREKTSMCFCSLSGNTLSFVLKSHWTGKVSIRFTGQLKKKVVVDWGIPGEPADELDFCNGGPSPETSRTNEGAQGVNVTIEIYSAEDDCSGALPINQPVTDGSQVSCNETATTQQGVFLFEVPGSGERVQIDVETEEDQEIP